MPALIYRCPLTGTNLQIWYEIDDDPAESADGLFESIPCKACGQTHLVDPKTAKVVCNATT